MKIFIDTGAFCALTIPKDQHNITAKTVYKEIQKEKSALFTSDYVLDEVYTLLKARSSHAIAVKFMDWIDKNSRITILHITEEIEEQAKTIFKRFEDKRLRFTDCTSFAFINSHHIGGAFSFDDHFRYHPYTHPIKFFGE